MSTRPSGRWRKMASHIEGLDGTVTTRGGTSRKRFARYAGVDRQLLQELQGFSNQAELMEQEAAERLGMVRSESSVGANGRSASRAAATRKKKAAAATTTTTRKKLTAPRRAGRGARRRGRKRPERRRCRGDERGHGVDWADNAEAQPVQGDETDRARTVQFAADVGQAVGTAAARAPLEQTVPSPARADLQSIRGRHGAFHRHQIADATDRSAELTAEPFEAPASAAAGVTPSGGQRRPTTRRPPRVGRWRAGGSNSEAGLVELAQVDTAGGEAQAVREQAGTVLHQMEDQLLVAAASRQQGAV